MVLFVLAGAASLGMLLFRERRERIAPFEAGALLLLLALGVGAAMYFRPAHVGVGLQGGISLPLAALLNLLLLGAEVGLLAVAWFRNEPGLANFALFVFFVQVFTRYFDLLGGMLSGGLMFIGAGLILVFGGFVLERSRRRLLDAMAQRRET
jgi:hypothetical protein